MNYTSSWSEWKLNKILRRRRLPRRIESDDHGHDYVNDDDGGSDNDKEDDNDDDKDDDNDVEVDNFISGERGVEVAGST